MRHLLLFTLVAIVLSDATGCTEKPKEPPTQPTPRPRLIKPKKAARLEIPRPSRVLV